MKRRSQHEQGGTIMGKRSNFPRRERDDYSTPWSAVAPLLPLLEPDTRFVEPCAGDASSIRIDNRSWSPGAWVADRRRTRRRHRGRVADLVERKGAGDDPGYCE